MCFLFSGAHAIEQTDIQKQTDLEKQIARLGHELTPMGANPKSNADGSIPAFTGTILAASASVQ